MADTPASRAGTALPSLSRQKGFIIDKANEKLLSLDIKKSILGIVLTEVGQDAVIEILAGREPEVDINLDVVGERHPEVINYIYNIVKARFDLLNQPARSETA